MKLCKENHIRVEIDAREEKLGFKIREAQMEKVPFMLILGEKEKKEQVVTVRLRDTLELGNQIDGMSMDEFIQLVNKES